jgi:hypothetical protein
MPTEEEEEAVAVARLLRRKFCASACLSGEK